MKVKVIESFKDKHTKVIYPAGKEIEITEERFAEILETGKFVEAVESKTTKKRTTKKATAKEEE